MFGISTQLILRFVAMALALLIVVSLVAPLLPVGR